MNKNKRLNKLPPVSEVIKKKPIDRKEFIKRANRIRKIWESEEHE